MRLLKNINYRLFKDFTRVYANLDKANYSIQEKEQIFESFIQFSKQLFKDQKLTFDPDGKKLSLSKGSPSIGEKALRNRIDKFGIEDLTGLTIYTKKDYRFGAHISILQQIGERPDYIDLTIAKPLLDKKDYNHRLDLFSSINKFVKIEYGYSYKALNYISLIGEGQYRRPFLYPIIQGPNDYWDDKIQFIKNGQIKRIYQFNCLNSIQLEQNKKLFHKFINIPDTDLTIAI
jgi:hypothetical protein